MEAHFFTSDQLPNVQAIRIWLNDLLSESYVHSAFGKDPQKYKLEIGGWEIISVKDKFQVIAEVDLTEDE